MSTTKSDGVERHAIFEETEDGELRILCSGEREAETYDASQIEDAVKARDRLRGLRTAAMPFRTKKEALQAANEDLKPGFRVYKHEEGQWIAEGELKEEVVA